VSIISSATCTLSAVGFPDDHSDERTIRYEPDIVQLFYSLQIKATIGPLRRCDEDSSRVEDGLCKRDIGAFVES
jgi:hypothetical protein